jgi:hypothetical protein
MRNLAVCNHIDRYRQLLKTELSDLEREFIKRRLEEDRSAMQMLASSTFPLTFKLPEPPTDVPPSVQASLKDGYPGAPSPDLAE